MGYKSCSHSRKCSEKNRSESHVELKLEERRRSEGDKRFRIHFQHLSDIRSLERYWTTRHLLNDKSTHAPFKISAKGIVRLINGAKNGATTVYMNGLVVPIHELDDWVEDFVKEVIQYGRRRMSCLWVPCSVDGWERKRGDILLQEIHKLAYLNSFHGTPLEISDTPRYSGRRRGA